MNQEHQVKKAIFAERRFVYNSETYELSNLHEPFTSSTVDCFEVVRRMREEGRGGGGGGGEGGGFKGRKDAPPPDLKREKQTN